MLLMYSRLYIWKAVPPTVHYYMQPSGYFSNAENKFAITMSLHASSVLASNLHLHIPAGQRNASVH